MALNLNIVFFEHTVLQYLAFEYDVEKRDNGSYSIQHPKYGIIDIFQKKQRLLIRRGNKWKSNAFVWINDNLLTEKFK